MAFTYKFEGAQKPFRCYFKEKGKLAQINVDNEESIDNAIEAVKYSLMQNSLPFKEAVLVCVK